MMIHPNSIERELHSSTDQREDPCVLLVAVRHPLVATEWIR